MPPTRRPYTPRLPPEARREQLLDAVIVVIARDGYAKVSIDAIAREAGVTRPVVYGVFSGLEPLLFALLDRQEQRALAQLLSAFPLDLPADDPEAVIVAAVRHLVEAVRDDPLTWRPILFAGAGTPAEVGERIARDREMVRRRIERLIKTATVNSGRDPSAIDAELAAHAAIGAAEYFGRLIVEDPGRFDAARFGRAVAGLIRAFTR